MANKQQRVDYKVMKDKLEASERSARYFKAEYETMYYAVKMEEIRPAYLEMLEKFHPELYKQLTGNQENSTQETTDGDIKE